MNKAPLVALAVAVAIGLACSNAQAEDFRLNKEQLDSVTASGGQIASIGPAKVKVRGGQITSIGPAKNAKRNDKRRSAGRGFF